MAVSVKKERGLKKAKIIAASEEAPKQVACEI
jgi:hypothetical protein